MIRVLALVFGLSSAGFTLYDYFANNVSEGVISSLVVCTLIAVTDVLYPD